MPSIGIDTVRVRSRALAVAVLLAGCGAGSASENSGALPGSGGAGGSARHGSGGSGAGPAGTSGGSGGGASATGGASGTPGNAGNGTGGAGGLTRLADIPGPADDHTDPPLSSTKGVALDPSWMAPVFAHDAAGNIVVMAQTGAGATRQTTIVKYNATLTQAWSVAVPANLTLASIAVNPAGEIFGAGVVEAPGASSTDAAFVALTPSGTVAWQQTVGGSTYNESASAIAVAPDGSLVAFGVTDGQLPGQPQAFGTEFQVGLSSDGSVLSTIEQQALPPPPDYVTSAVTDDRDSTYVTFPPTDGHGHPSQTVLMKLDSSGNSAWPAANDQLGPLVYSAVYSALAGGSGNLGLLFAMSPGGARLYYLLHVASGNGDAGGWRIFGIDPASRSLAWDRTFVQIGPVTLNAVEGSTWTGFFGQFTSMVATPDAVFIAGTYSESYFGGAMPKPSYGAVFVQRLDMTGQQDWIRLFAMVDAQGTPVARAAPTIVLADTDRLVFTAQDETGASRFFTLDPSDGSGP